MPTTRNAVVFRANLAGSYADVQRKAVVILNGVTFKLYADIVERTRVDTGRARAGWQISVYAAGQEAPPAGKHVKPTSATFVAELSSAPLEAKRVIYNNVAYIVWLEFGTSSFAGDHMVRLAIQRLRNG